MKVIRVKLPKAYLHIAVIVISLLVFDFSILWGDTNYKGVICILLFQFLGILAGYECGQWKTLDIINKAIKYTER